MEIYEFGQQLTREAGRFIKLRMQEDFKVNSKQTPNDLVTDVDKETEDYIVSQIKNKYPEHHIIGEENAHNVTDTKGYIWIIDPIDGTMNFVHQLQHFAVSIGVFKDGAPYAGFILNVMTDELYYAKSGNGAFKNDIPLNEVSLSPVDTSIVSFNPKWVVKQDVGAPFQHIIKDVRNTRSYGSAALDFAYVSSGLLNGILFYRLHPWDFAAGMIIAKEVGVITTNLLGEDVNILKPNSVLAANSQLHQNLKQYFLNDETFIDAHNHSLKLK